MSGDTFTKDRLAWLDAIVAHPELDGAAFKLAYVISGLVNRRKGYAWPGLAYLAAAMDLNERSIRRLIEALVVHGFLGKIRRGDRQTNSYRMVLTDRTPMSTQNEDRPDTSVHSEASDRTSVTDRVDIYDRQTGHQCPPISLNISLRDLSEEESISVNADSKGDLERDFEELWSHYPRKVSKGKARSAYKAALKRADFPTIKAGVVRYAAERANQDHQFTKHFASWLNAECWQDEPAQVVAGRHGAARTGTFQTNKDRTLAALRVVRGGGA